MEDIMMQREVIVRLFQLSNAMQTHIDQLLKEFEITAKQFFMMIIIGQLEGAPSIGDITPHFGTSRQNVKQVLLKLERRGFIEFVDDPSDRRTLRVRATKEAHQFWANRQQEDMMSITRIFGHVDTNQTKLLLDSMRHMLEQIEQMKKE